ncbi:hypothetical protein Bbelb_391980 [Branchiostoma belcheri]|nr:hypothetical protein Bbelb_391980 [Branchiostoma belcheri]
MVVFAPLPQPGGFKATGPATDIQMFMIEDTDTPSDQTHGPSLLSAQNTTVAWPGWNGPYGLPWPCPAPTCFHPGLSPLVKPSELPVFYPRINFGLPASSGKPSPPTADTHPVQPRVASFGPIPGLLPTARDRRVQNSPSGSDRTSPRVPSTSPSLEKTVSDRAEFRLSKDKSVSREVDISGGKRKRPEKKFPCPFCTVCCANNGQLKGHLRVHTVSQCQERVSGQLGTWDNSAPGHLGQLGTNPRTNYSDGPRRHSAASAKGVTLAAQAKSVVAIRNTTVCH